MIGTRQVRRAHGNSRLIAVHGQPGANQEGQHSGIDLDPQLPQPSPSTWQVKPLESKAADVYRYMNFDQIPEFKEVADTVTA